MKKIYFICFVLSTLIYSQYEDTGKRGIYFSKKTYTEKSIPTFKNSRDKLPSPIIEDKPEWINLYWKTWQLAFDHFRKPPKGSPFVSNYLDEAFAPNIFQWDTFFMIMFARYANHIFPAIESLDNFYCRQYENGYICREIVEATGEDFVFEGREHTVNPPLFSWTEIENFQITGDESRFEQVLPALGKYAEWLEKFRKKENTKHNLYWQTGLGSGMDNTPRSGSGWVDMSSQMVMMYNDMAKMCNELSLTEKENLFRTKAKEISERINKFMWNEDEGLYYDIDDEGNQIKWKTAACFWPMLAGVADLHQAEKLLANLKDPNSFWRKIPFPSLAADQKNYAADGKYWLGSVWASTNVMIIKGLDKFGIGNDNAYNFNEFASLATEEYLNGIYEIYKKTGTLWENYSAEAFARGVWSRPDFVGWTGCGPIELLIENIIGLRPNGVDNTLTWHLSRIDRHGIEKLKFGNVTVSLTCERRESVNSPTIINIQTDNVFDLIIERGHNNYKTFHLIKGRNKILME
jgi:glycogen debranching enzyme